MKLLEFMRKRRWNAWLKPHQFPSMARELDALRKENAALRRWVHARHVPTMRSVPSDPLRALLQTGRRLIVVAALLSASCASAQPIFRTRYTTNTTAVIDAFVSAGGTNSRQFGTLSLTNLSGNPNVATNILGAGTVTVTSNNAGAWTITGSAGTPGLTTNENQFLGVPLSIKTGAFQTNFNGWFPGTNNGNFRIDGDFVMSAGDATLGGGLFPDLDDNRIIGNSGQAWLEAFLKSGGLHLVESIGSDNISLVSPALAASYSLTLPNSQGANGTVITNNGSGLLGWWDATAVIAQKQLGSANLTNWSNIPTGSMANVVSTTFLTNWANAISNYVTAATNSASVTNWINFSQPASANLTNWSLIPTGAMANIVATDFLTNWANSISNLTATKQHGTATLTNLSNNPYKGYTNEVFGGTNISVRTSGGTNFIDTTGHLNNWAQIPTGAMANVVSTDFLTNWANAISNLTQTKTALTTNANQFGASVQLTIKDGPLITNSTMHGTTDHVGAVTNESRMNTAGGVTNWSQTEVKGTFNASSNLVIKAGQSDSNAWAGGLIYWSNSSFTNLNGTATTFTNLATNQIAGHVLTNNGDMIYAVWKGRMPVLANTNNFQIIYGSETILDTGLQVSSNSSFKAECWITRTGNTAQHAEGRFEWGPGSGSPFAFTNTNVELTQTNGIGTILQLRGAARRVGAHTNNSFRVYFDPAVR